MTLPRLLVVLALSTATLAAQDGPPADAGTLRVRSGGRVVAEEEFQLRPEAGGLTLSVTARRGDATTVALVAMSGRRLTVRLSGAGGETARELPFSDRGVVADDSLFSFLALLPRATPGPVQVIRARTGSRESGTLDRQGLQPVMVDGANRTLRQYELRVGDRTVRAWFDDEGRLMRALVVGADLEVVRVATP